MAGLNIGLRIENSWLLCLKFIKNNEFDKKNKFSKIRTKAFYNVINAVEFG